jgi:hypothetical protein
MTPEINYGILGYVVTGEKLIAGVMESMKIRDKALSSVSTTKFAMASLGETDSWKKT